MKKEHEEYAETQIGLQQLQGVAYEILLYSYFLFRRGETGTEEKNRYEKGGGVVHQFWVYGMAAYH
jgi:hypothetical protein